MSNEAKTDKPWWRNWLSGGAVAAVIGGVFTLATKDPLPVIYSKNACELKPESFGEGTCVGCLNQENRYGRCVITADPNWRTGANQVDWPFNLKQGGYYKISVRYAAAEERSLELIANSVVVNKNALATPTGGWYEKDQQTLPQGFANLPPGDNIIQMKRNGGFPHIQSVILTRCNWFSEFFKTC